MSEAFKQLCAEVFRATQSLTILEQCRPHYQRVLDYILAHPGERKTIADLLGRNVRYGYEPNGVLCQIELIQFLMSALKWPEIKVAAEDAIESAGPSWLELKELLEIYGVYQFIK